ncbi:MAG: signal peptidase I [Ruminococcus sp.]|nr:signal peptidase I [Ruminococcus sp.]
MKLKHKRKESNQDKIEKWVGITRTVKNTVCWVLIGVLAISMIVFFVTKINGGTPTVFGYSIQRVSSGSMEPELMVGDAILSKEVGDAGSLREGDIITFQGGAQYGNNRVTHRIIRGPRTVDGKVVLQTKGDANEVADEEITADDVLSKYIGKIDILTRLYELFLSPWGLIIFVGLLLIIFFDELINIVRILTGNYPDEDEESISEIIERIQREEAEKEALKHSKNDKPKNKKGIKSNRKKKKDNSKKDKKEKRKEKYRYKGTKKKRKKRKKVKHR